MLATENEVWRSKLPRGPVALTGGRVERPEDLGPALREALAHDGSSPVDVVMESPVPIP